MGHDVGMASVEERIQALEDREEIRLLRHRYHQLINEGRYDEIPGLFTDDAALDFGYLGATSGRERITRFFSRAGDLLEFVRQFIHNHIVELDGDSATGVSYMEAKSISGGTAYFVAGRYDDRYERTADGWRFSRMDFEPVFTVPFHEGWATDQRLQMGADRT